MLTCQDVSFGGITIMVGVQEMSLSCLLKIWFMFFVQFSFSYWGGETDKSLA